MISMVVGASAGVGRATAKILAEQGHDLFLVASRAEDLRVVAADLTIRYRVKVEWEAVELSVFDVSALKERFLKSFSTLDNLFLIAGLSMMDLDFEGLNTIEVHRLVKVNFEGPVDMTMAFLDLLKENGPGNLVGVGTVASARGRFQNTLYAAAKRGLEFFFEGLAQRYSGTTLKVQFYRFGYIDTSMNKSEPGLIPKWSPERTAATLVKNLDKEIPMAYLPSWWRWIMLIYQCIPWPIYKKMVPKY